MQPRHCVHVCVQGLAGPAAIAAANLSSDSDSSSSSGDVDDPEHHADRDHKAAMTGRAAKQALAVNIRMPRWVWMLCMPPGLLSVVQWCTVSCKVVVPATWYVATWLV